MYAPVVLHVVKQIKRLTGEPYICVVERELANSRILLHHSGSGDKSVTSELACLRTRMDGNLLFLKQSPLGGT